MKLARASLGLLFTGFGLLTGCGLVGCGATVHEAPRWNRAVVEEPRIPERGPDGWPTTAIALQNDLGWPLRAHDIAVVVDGTITYRGNAEPGVLAVIEVPPGHHALLIRISATYPIAPFADEECTVTLRQNESFTTTDAPARIGLSLYSRGVTTRYDQRLVLDVSYGPTSPDGSGSPIVKAGWTVEAQLPATLTPDAVCNELSLSLDEARRQRDVVTSQCLNDLLTQAHAAARVHRERQAELEAATARGDAARVEHERAVVDVIRARLQQLRIDAQHCGSNLVDPISPEGVIWQDDTCSGVEVL